LGREERRPLNEAGWWGTREDKLRGRKINQMSQNLENKREAWGYWVLDRQFEEGKDHKDERAMRSKDHLPV